MISNGFEKKRKRENKKEKDTPFSPSLVFLA